MEKDKSSQIRLQDHIYKNLMSNSLMALVLLGVISMAIYVVSILIAESLISDVLLNKSISNIQDTVVQEKAVMEIELKEIERTLGLFQVEESAFFKSLPKLEVPETDLFDYHENGVFYKLRDDGGASLYYSSDTVIGYKELKKAYYTQAFDGRYRAFVQSNPLVAQVYINTHDNMNRLYPFMPDAPAQYGPTLKMSDYNFYYLADMDNNPSREPVWTKAYLDPAGMGWMVSCVAPVYNDDFLEGVTGADITVDLLIKNFMVLDIESLGGIVVTDGEGDIIAMDSDVEGLFRLTELKDHEYTETIDGTIYKPEDYSINNLSIEGQFPFMSISNSLDTRYSFSVKGNRYHILKNTIEATGWDIFVLVDEEKALRDINEVSNIFREMMIYLMILIILLILMNTIWFNRKAKNVSISISVPIERLTHATNLVGRSMDSINLDQDGDIYEINDLNDQFIKMSEELNARTKELIEKETEKKIQEKLAEKYKAEAMTDALTQLYNRRKIDDALNDEIVRAQRDYHPLSIILVDIDDFKLVNDNHGHLVGDEVLEVFAAILEDHTGPTDIVGRWGGEEFLIICPYTKAEDAVVLAEKLRQVINDYDFGLQEKVTASFGVAQYAGNDRRNFFGKVDMAMYDAKNRSKNVVVNYEDDEATDS